MYTNTRKFLYTALCGALALLAVWAALRFLLPWLAPFLAAFACAALVEPAVQRLSRDGRIPRSVASAFCVLILLGFLLALIWLVCVRALAEARALLERLPVLIGELSETLTLWREKLSGLADVGEDTLRRVGDAIEERLLLLPGTLSGKALSLAAEAAASAPAALLFAATAMIGAYFTSASYPSLKRFLAAQLPESARARAAAISAGARRTLWRYLRAQGLMLLLTFLALTLAFGLLHVDYALLLALGTAVIDALPVLGTGTVLIPWALYEFLTGQTSLGLGLGITYLAVTMLRNCAQAKLLGDQLGLHPLATLLAIYVGFHVCGVWGMLLFPVLAIGLKQLNDSGTVHLWKNPAEEAAGKGESHGRSDFQHHCGNGNEHTRGHEYPSR